MSTRTNYKDLLDAGVHFGHLTRKWDPRMAPYIFMEKNDIHIIDLHKTVAKVEDASNALKQMAKSGKKIMFVATKKQAKDIVAERVKKTGMPYVTERWAGGMLTNFATIRKAIRKMQSIEKLLADDTAKHLQKKERLMLDRQRQKLETQLGSIRDLNRLPAALFIVDIKKEHIAVKEARKLNIPTFAMVDTNSDPNAVDFPIPANDDASSSIEKIIDLASSAVEEGLNERKLEKEKAQADKANAKQKKTEKAKEKAESTETKEEK
jgi:small subunit ribosomal protein S2